MSFLKNLKEIPGVGRPVEDNNNRSSKEPGPIRQALGVISEDLQTRAAQQILGGYKTIVDPLVKEPKRELTEEEREKKAVRKERRKKVAGYAKKTATRVGKALWGLAFGVGQKNKQTGLVKGEIIDGNFVEDESDSGSEDING